MPKPRHEPVRTCIACREEALKVALVRVVRAPDGSAVIDRTGHEPGRGAYLHRQTACLEAARKRRQLERNLGAGVPPQLWSDLASV